MQLITPSIIYRTGLRFGSIWEGKRVEGIREVRGGVISRSLVLVTSLGNVSEILATSSSLVVMSKAKVERGARVLAEWALEEGERDVSETRVSGGEVSREEKGLDGFALVVWVGLGVGLFVLPGVERDASLGDVAGVVTQSLSNVACLNSLRQASTSSQSRRTFSFS